MVTLGKYASLIIACDPIIQGTAICHKKGNCPECDIAWKHDTQLYLQSHSKALGCTVEVSPTQLSKLAETMKVHGFPLCLCKAFVPGIVEPDGVRCPCPEAPADIEAKGRCHCGIFKKVK